MLIIADENMPFVRDWFAPFGIVQTMPGRAIGNDELSNADVLLVRSITQVNQALLEGSRVRFVASATSGIEHMDVDYLQRHGIGYASAPGCNATAVVEYVLSCICALDGVLEKLLKGGTVGIVGLGNVGARLAQRFKALDISCVAYDPFLTQERAAEIGAPSRDLDTVLNADVVCCHTPLTKNNSYPTWHLLDDRRLKQLRNGAVLINASRGAVVDNAALLNLLNSRDDVRVVLDVWEGEPLINPTLLAAVDLATPHIAGYSWDGKVAGTRMVLEAFCSFFNLPLPDQALAVDRPRIKLSPDENVATLIRRAVQAVYDVRHDDQEIRTALSACEPRDIPVVFDRLRKNYPQRREFAAYEIENWNALDSASRSVLRKLGFGAE